MYVRKTEDADPPCLYTGGVGCKLPGVGCYKCGWNPEVNEARVKAMLSEADYEIYLNRIREQKRY